MIWGQAALIKTLKECLPSNIDEECSAYKLPHVTVNVILFPSLAELRKQPAGKKLKVPLLVPIAEFCSTGLLCCLCCAKII